MVSTDIKPCNIFTVQCIFFILNVQPHNMPSKISTLILLLFTCTYVHAQDSTITYRVDRFLSVDFPRMPDSNHTQGFIIRFVRTEVATYMVMINDSLEINVHSESAYNHELKGFVTGFVESPSMRNFKNTESDTTIGGVKG